MLRRLLRLLIASAVVAAVHAAPPDQVHAQTFTPPQQIVVRMFRLTPNGNNSGELCDPAGDSSFGCVAVAGRGTYPYTTNPITIPIESDYLLNVVPQEMPLSFEPIALQSQVVAARTYAYYHINRGNPINNSIQYQAFVPGKFILLSNITPTLPLDPCASDNLGVTQCKLCGAMDVPRYLAYSNSTFPIQAMFSADWPTRTVSSGVNTGLVGVDDPVSNTTNGVCISSGAGSHGRGMSQTGANRWARGSQCAYVVNGPRWSVRWTSAAQILHHYYTNVRLRDANAVPLTPDRRWNPLDITGLPVAFTSGEIYMLGVKVQNTGIGALTCEQTDECFSLGYRWHGPGGQLLAGSDYGVLPPILSPGDPSAVVPLRIADVPAWPSGAYTLTLDLRAHGPGGTTTWFSESGWPAYTLTVAISNTPALNSALALSDTLSQTVYLPLLSRPVSVQCAP
jgi:Stage II sporulation protein